MINFIVYTKNSQRSETIRRDFEALEIMCLIVVPDLPSLLLLRVKYSSREFVWCALQLGGVIGIAFFKNDGDRAVTVEEPIILSHTSSEKLDVLRENFPL